MKTQAMILSLACALTLALASTTAQAQATKTAGMVCWNGDIEYIGTTKKDLGWSWKLNYTYLSDDKDPARNSSGRCFGTGGMMAGKAETSPYFCTSKSPDGSTRMNRSIIGANHANTKGIYFGGTGKFKGVVGTSLGSARIKLPAAKGKIAGCRHYTGEYTVAK